MEVVYLGFFSSVCNFVMKHILHPIFEFVSGLFNTIFTWLFKEVLAPILLPVLKEVLNFAIGLYMQVFGTMFYLLFTAILKILDYLQIGFDVFIGLSDVKYSSGGKTVTGNILTVLLRQDSIGRVFWLITFGGMSLALIFTIIATAKSAFDLDFEGKRPVSRVLSSCLRCFVQFLMIPFSTLFILQVAGIILKTINLALGGSSATTLGRTVFVICSLNAAKEDRWNSSSGINSSMLGTAATDKIRYPFYTGVKDYADLAEVSKSFDVSKFDYLMGILVALFLLIVIGSCLIVFVQRIFEIMMLYLASPYFVATMPLDDGERFGKWKELFLGKVFTGYGSAIGMRIYLMVCPMVMGNQIRFIDNGSSTEMEYIIRLFFLLGGAWAVFKSGSLLTSLISIQAGQTEAATSAVAGGFLFAHTAGSAMGMARKMAGQGLSKMTAGGSGRSGGGAGKNGGENSQAFTGKPGEETLKLSLGQGKSADKKQMSEASKRSGALKSAKTGLSGGPKLELPEMSAASELSDPLKSSDASGGSEHQETSESFEGSKDSTDKLKKPPGSIVSFGDKVGFVRNADSKVRLQLKFGSVLNNSYDQDGNHKFRIMGMGYTSNKDGKVIARRFPIAKQDLGGDGKLHVSRVKLPGIATFRANTDTNKLYLSDVGLAGVHLERKGADNHISKASAFYGKTNYSNDGQHEKFDFGALKVVSRADDNKKADVRLGGLSFRTGGGITAGKQPDKKPE